MDSGQEAFWEECDQTNQEVGERKSHCYREDVVKTCEHSSSLTTIPTQGQRTSLRKETDRNVAGAIDKIRSIPQRLDLVDMQ
jgi:hypothetical protein